MKTKTYDNRQQPSEKSQTDRKETWNNYLFRAICTYIKFNFIPQISNNKRNIPEEKLVLLES